MEVHRRLLGRKRSGDILHVSLIRQWGGAIRNHAIIKQLVEALDITYVVIDSAVMACAGTDRRSPEAPSKYDAALQVIGFRA